MVVRIRINPKNVIECDTRESSVMSNTVLVPYGIEEKIMMVTKYWLFEIRKKVGKLHN